MCRPLLADGSFGYGAVARSDMPAARGQDFEPEVGFVSAGSNRKPRRPPSADPELSVVVTRASDASCDLDGSILTQRTDTPAGFWAWALAGTRMSRPGHVEVTA